MREESAQETNSLDLIWGASAIAAEIGVDPRKAFWMLEQGTLPAKRVGRRWVVSRAKLREFFTGEAA